MVMKRLLKDKHGPGQSGAFTEPFAAITATGYIDVVNKGLEVLLEHPKLMLSSFTSDPAELQFGTMGNVTLGTRAHASENELLASCRNSGLYDIYSSKDRYRNFYKCNKLDFNGHFRNLSSSISNIFESNLELNEQNCHSGDNTMSVIFKQRKIHRLFIKINFPDIFQVMKSHKIRHNLAVYTTNKLLKIWRNETVHDYFVFKFTTRVELPDIFEMYLSFYKAFPVLKYDKKKYKLQQANSVLAQYNELNNDVRISTDRLARWATRSALVTRDIDENTSRDEYVKVDDIVWIKFQKPYRHQTCFYKSRIVRIRETLSCATKSLPFVFKDEILSKYLMINTVKACRLVEKGTSREFIVVNEPMNDTLYRIKLTKLDDLLMDIEPRVPNYREMVNTWNETRCKYEVKFKGLTVAAKASIEILRECVIANEHEPYLPARHRFIRNSNGPELKAMLRECGLRVCGKVADLKMRLLDHEKKLEQQKQTELNQREFDIREQQEGVLDSIEVLGDDDIDWDGNSLNK